VRVVNDACCRCPVGRRLVTHGSYELCENINVLCASGVYVWWVQVVIDACCRCPVGRRHVTHGFYELCENACGVYVWWVRVVIDACCRCPVGRRLVTHGSYDLCENINECAEYSNLCHRGNCYDTDDGFYCDCNHGYGGVDCSEKLEDVSVFISTSAIIVLVTCAVCAVSEYRPISVYQHQRYHCARHLRSVRYQ